MVALECHFTGLDQYCETVARMDQRARQVMLKDAMKAAAAAVMRSIRDLAPRETGLLKSAVGSKTRVNAEGTGVYAVIGISRKTVDLVAAQSRVRLPKGQLAVMGMVSRLGLGDVAKKDIATATAIAGARRRKPSKYYFNVEKGHGGPHPAGAHPFIEPAFAAAQQAVSQIMYTYARQAVSPIGAISAVAGGEAGVESDSAGAEVLGESMRKAAVRSLQSAIRKTIRTGGDREGFAALRADKPGRGGGGRLRHAAYQHHAF
jgi:hypothetical protein